MADAKKRNGKKKSKKVRKTNADRPAVKGAEYVEGFMHALIGAGHLSKIPEDNKERKQAAQRLRQMATTLARQVHDTLAKGKPE